MPCAAARSSAIARSRLLAATPPPMRMSSIPRLEAASIALRVSTSHTASWNDAATSATSIVTPSRCWASTQRATAVLSPENEKSKRCRSRSRRLGQPAREVDGDAVAAARGPVDVRTARERQAEQPGDLVERLARGVVDRRAHRLDADGHVGDLEQAGVAAGDQHRQAGLGQRAVLELVDGDVGGEVVDAVDRLAEPDRERLGAGDADQQRAGEAGAAGHRDRVDVVERDAGGLAGPLDRRAPSPRGAPGWRPRARRRRSGRAPRRCSPPCRRAGCGRGRCRRRSRRRRSRCRGRGARQSLRVAVSARAAPGSQRHMHQRLRRRRGSSGGARRSR